MYKMKQMTQLDLSNQKILIREDLNVPLKDGAITNNSRIRAALPTLKLALDSGARVMVMSHLGRPKEDQINVQFSLQPIAQELSKLLEKPVRLIQDWTHNSFSVAQGEIVLLENTRFNIGEKNDDEQLAKKIASLCDIFVMDAFGVSHRAQASTHAVIKFAPIACAGLLLVKEIDSLCQALKNPKKPMVAIVGGAKVSSKLNILESLVKICDQLIVGGGIANTFLYASGKNIGKSLSEIQLKDQANSLLKHINIPLPVDVKCARNFNENELGILKNINDVDNEDMILDIGPKTQEIFNSILQNAGTILWNGPVGVFEFKAFSAGTKALALSIANSSAFSIAGGGDTLSAIDTFNVREKISYISTGGGAFLEFIEGKQLPSISMLESRYLT